MKLKYIELRGFKSFAKKERLDFEKRLTAIVGPNGSGKSNIAEAFRFVLGEQSMKSMRSKKTEDLLFNGSAFLPRTNRASVTLVFDNSDRAVKGAFDEVEIERVIHRDSTNEYYINGSPVRLKDVVELLAEAKVGSAGHHIISQGEADKLLSMSPRDRRVHIEEALGLTQYQIKRAEAEKKLEKTQANLESIRSLRRENAPHLQYLEKEMSLIEKRREIIRELDLKGKEYAQKFIAFHARTQERNKIEEEELVSKIRDADKRVQAVRGQRVAGGVDRELERLEAAQKEIQIRLNSLRSEKANMAHAVGKLEAELEFRSEAVSSATNPQVFVKTSEKIERLRELLEKAREEIDINKIKEIIAKALSVIRADDKQASDSKIDPELEARIAKITAELRSHETRSSELVELEEELMGRSQKLEVSIREKQRDGEQRRIDAEKSIYEKRALEAKLESLHRESESLKEDHARFFASLEEIALIAGVHFSKEDLRMDESMLNLSRVEIDKIERDVERLKLKIESMQVGNSSEVERAYAEAKERAEFLDREIEDLEATTSKLSNIARELGEKIEDEFSSGLGKISGYFSNYFSHMFKGGSASLQRVELPSRNEEKESEKEFGVDIKVSMPHKLLRSTAMLSGGEKTLVSIALIFALSQINPPPFLILDETDAALDEANSRRYGEALGELSKYSQLILITHNRETMSHAGMLYGITMGKSATSELLSIDLEEAEKIAR